MAITSILGGTFTELTVIKGADIDGTTLIVDPDNDRVGIGLLLPKTKLTVEGALTMKEQAAADSDTAAYGQLWIKTATPNELYFTTDAGDDIQLTTGTDPAGGGASALNDLSDVSYSSGDLIITSLDKLTTSASAHDAAGVAIVMQAGSTTAGTSNNQAGGALTIAGGQGKGSGAGGDIVFQTANAGGSGSSINSLATALTISDDLSSTFAGVLDVTDTTDASDNSGDTGALRCEGGASIAMKLYVGSDTHLPNNVYIGKSLFHADDTTTRLHFFNTNDTIALEVANLDFLRCVEDGTSSESVFNYSGHANIDFRVSGDAETHLFYIDAGNERISIGDSVDAPAATLEITNHASAGATGVPLLQLNSNDTDQIALDINAANIDADVISITADALTSEGAIDISVDALTSGCAVCIASDSADTSARNLVHILNNDALAVNAVNLHLKNTAEAGLIRCVSGANGASMVLKITTTAITLNTGSAVTTASNFFPAGAIPFSLAIRVTTTIDSARHIERLGTGTGTSAPGRTDSNIYGELAVLADGVLDAAGDTQIFGLNWGDQAYSLSAQNDLVITCNNTPTAGAVRVALYYWQVAAPSS